MLSSALEIVQSVAALCFVLLRVCVDDDHQDSLRIASEYIMLSLSFKVMNASQMKLVSVHSQPKCLLGIAQARRKG